jgi:hypothetical protein
MVDYAATYQLQIDDSSSFNLPLIHDYTVISGLSQIIDSLPDGKYYWHVRAQNVINVYGPWSSYRYFTIDTVAPPSPVLSGPVDGSSPVGTPTFSWKASATASRYQFEYNSTDDPNTYLYKSGDLTTLSYKPPTIEATNPLSPIYWFVRAKDAAENWSPWSGSFTVTIFSQRSQLRQH